MNDTKKSRLTHYRYGIEIAIGPEGRRITFNFGRRSWKWGKA